MGLQILNYGGGRQTVAIVVLVLRGLLERPDRIITANTGRENPTTWDYLQKHVQPALAEIGLTVEVIPPRCVYDLWSDNGNTCLIPVCLLSRLTKCENGRAVDVRSARGEPLACSLTIATRRGTCEPLSVRPATRSSGGMRKRRTPFSGFRSTSPLTPNSGEPCHADVLLEIANG